LQVMSGFPDLARASALSCEVPTFLNRALSRATAVTRPTRRRTQGYVQNSRLVPGCSRMLCAC